MTDESTPVTAGAEFSLADLDYDLPEALVAQEPLVRRDASRMLVVDRNAGRVSDHSITDLPTALRPKDLLVLNNTKVLPAKFVAHRVTGGKIGGLFVHEEALGLWRVMLQGSRHLRLGEALSVSAKDETTGATLTIAENLGGGFWRVRVEPTHSAVQVLSTIGQTPLPPYIHRTEMADDGVDRDRYQTIYAQCPGAIAAPTAGLHLSEGLLQSIHDRAIETTFVTLHVGVGTFKPIDADDIRNHVMHSEWFELSSGAAEAVDRCRQRGGRVVAVGTTSVRVLETAMARSPGGKLIACGGDTDIFIYPPYRFRAVDALLTNFHLPRSTLLALVMAFGGVDRIRKAYAYAMEHGYRFYSYGDAMLIT